MIVIKDLVLRNFLSVGNVSQAIDFNTNNLTLVLGENLDLGGIGNKNATGKSTIINALSYVLYGNALTNIKKDNLINQINRKQMFVAVSFTINDTEYRIERGRRPTFLRLIMNGHEKTFDDSSESQGDSRETQKEIEKIIGMSHDMFKHIVALNTYTEPFLSLRSSDQRSIIEQLLGITQLSEKAELLKEQIRSTKEKISLETAKIDAISSSNEKIKQSINQLKRKKAAWNNQYNKDLQHLENELEKKSTIDIDTEIQNQIKLREWTQQSTALDTLNNNFYSKIRLYEKEKTLLKKLETELSRLKNKTCHSCGQTLHNTQHETLLKSKNDQINECNTTLARYESDLLIIEQDIAELGELKDKPSVHYISYEEAIEHKNIIEKLNFSIEYKKNESNPYLDQIEELEKTAFQEIDWTVVNDLSTIKDHQEFLYKMLTKSDSFVRKKIIDQNLAFLNQRLSYYTTLAGLPHTVEFLNDLSVKIDQLGHDLDFDNLSRGERNRLILSLSWSFRDIFESLNNSINVLFVDEILDSGLDPVGLDLSIKILKDISRDRKKSVFLISHRDSVVSKADQILKVTKENGFTTYMLSDEY